MFQSARQSIHHIDAQAAAGSHDGQTHVLLGSTLLCLAQHCLFLLAASTRMLYYMQLMYEAQMLSTEIL